MGRRAGGDGIAARGKLRLIATRNAAVARLARALERLADTDLSLLIEGETGAGKSELARRIHRRSRGERPLIVVDCAALPPTLLPAELFGHVAGAFTDATRSRLGALERAGAGTVVLDRVDCLAAEAQVALLRAVEERVFVPVGGAAARRLGARFIALAAPGLLARTRLGAFRADLYHRLAGSHLVLPPLRERPEDLLPAARALLRRRPALELDAEAARLLTAYSWPGNFRELEATLARARLLARTGRVTVAELDLHALDAAAVVESALARELSLAEVDRLYALAVLARHGGNVSAAARALGVSRRTLNRWRLET